jgi:hypothetical protein
VLYGDAKKHPVKASHHQPKANNPDTTNIGPRSIRDKTNKPIFTDLLAICRYPIPMLEEENNRLKRLLIATVSLYLVSWIAAYASNKLLYDFRYIGLFIENQWIAYLILFFGLAWMPATIFLFIQARSLNKKMKYSENFIDKSVVTLSITLPIVMAIVYIGTRIFYR